MALRSFMMGGRMLRHCSMDLATNEDIPLPRGLSIFVEGRTGLATYRASANEVTGRLQIVRSCFDTEGPAVLLVTLVLHATFIGWYVHASREFFSGLGMAMPLIHAVFGSWATYHSLKL